MNLLLKKILVHAYRGGSGKTLVSINLAMTLVHSGKRVLLIETDAAMPSFEEIFTIKPKYSFNDFYEGKAKFEDLPCFLAEGIDVILCSPEFLPAQKIFSTDQTVHTSNLRLMMTGLNRLVEKYEYCILDSAPGWGYIQINNLLLTDILILLIRGSLSAVRGTNKLIQTVYLKAREVQQKNILVWNQIPQKAKMLPLINMWQQDVESNLFPIYKTFYIYNDNDLGYEVAMGNHILQEPSKFMQTIAEIANCI